MFDRFKERLVKLEEDHDNVRKAHEHVVKYQVVYATIGGSAVTLVAVKLFGKPQVIVKGDSGLPMVINNTVAPVIAPVMSNTVNNTGYCTKIVQGLDDDGKLWPKAAALAAELAEEHGVSFEAARTLLSKHLNGHTDHAYGKRYVTYGLGTTG
jgi:hypothetical protein